MDYVPEDAARRALRMAAPIGERLAVIADDFRGRLAPYSAALDLLVNRLRASDALAGAPAVGAIFPDFMLPETNGRLWHLAAALDRGPMVLSFHRGNWCDFCHLNMTVLAEIAPRLAAMDVGVAAITPQNAAEAGNLARHAQAGYPVLCDVGLGVSTALGLCYVVDADLRRELTLLDVDLDDANLGHGAFLPVTATFVLDRDGRVTARHVDPDPRLRMDDATILQAAAAVQLAARS